MLVAILEKGNMSDKTIRHDVEALTSDKTIRHDVAALTSDKTIRHDVAAKIGAKSRMDIKEKFTNRAIVLLSYNQLILLLLNPSQLPVHVDYPS